MIYLVLILTGLLIWQEVRRRRLARELDAYVREVVTRQPSNGDHFRKPPAPSGPRPNGAKHHPIHGYRANRW